MTSGSIPARSSRPACGSRTSSPQRWHGRDGGRLRYAFTPRFAVSCTAELLRESAALAKHHGAYWQTHLSEDAGEIDEVGRLFPEARDYLDVYDRAGGVGERTILAHAIHLCDREVARLVEAGPASRIARRRTCSCRAGSCRSAPTARRHAVGLGSDVAAGPELSMFTVMRAGAVTQRVLELTGRADRSQAVRRRLAAAGTLGGAAALGLEDGDRIDRARQGGRSHRHRPAADDAAAGRRAALAAADDVMSRLIFRPHPNMVRGAWVRGRLLAGPPGLDAIG